MKSVAKVLCTLTVFCLLPFAGSVQAEVMLQWFETDWDEMYQKLPLVAQVGYDSLWIPPPSKAPTGTSTKWGNVGYSLYDRFDLGDVPQRGTRETRYGSRGSLRNMIDNAQRLGIKIIPDIVMNHNGNGPDFREYPGMSATDFHVQWQEGYLNTLNFKRAPRMNWWSHHDGYGATMWTDLANLADIRTEDHPLNPDPKRFTGQKTDSDNQSFNFVDGTSYVRHVGQYDRYPYAYTNENAAEMLYRWIVWLGDAINYDGLRIDAAKHTPYEFFGWRGSGFLHEAQWNFAQRRGYSFGGNPTDLFLNDRDRTNAFIFAEILSNWGDIEYWYRQGTGNPMRFLDAEMKNTADSCFTGDLTNLGKFGTDFGPATGVTYVWGHDSVLAPNAKAILAYAYILCHVGVPMVYYTGNNISWADSGRVAWYPGGPRTWMYPGFDDYALGDIAGKGALANLVWINQNFARGAEVKRWDNDSDFFALERYEDVDGNGLDVGDGIMILALNDSGSDQFRTLQTAFPPFTVLHDFTGNAGDITVKSTGAIDVTVPGNFGQGWVVYAPQCADGVVVGFKENGSPAGAMNWVVPGGATNNVGSTTQQVVRITNDTLTVDTFVTQVPAGINVDNVMLKWGAGIQLPVTNYFDSGRGTVSGRFHNMNKVNATNYALTFSTTNLAEGLHVLKARAFTQRDASYSAIYNTQTKVVYIDRHGPDLELDCPDTFKGDALLTIRNPDFTAYEVFVKIDGGAEQKADQMMKGTFRFALSGLSAGAHVVAVRATEYNYAKPRAQINESTATKNITVQSRANPALALALDCPDKTSDDVAELPFFKLAAAGASTGAKLHWDGYELPWNAGNYTNVFNGQVIQRDNAGRVVTNRLWGAFINGAHFFILKDGDDTVVKRVVLNLYGANHIDSDGDGLPDNVEMPFFDQGAPGADQPWPGDSNYNFVPDPGENWTRLNPYNHSTFFELQWDDRRDNDGDGFTNFEEVHAGYLDGNIYAYDIYNSSSKPSGAPGTVSSATCDPTPADPGASVTITYTPNEGPLAGASQVVMHIGHSKRTMGSWQEVQDIPMTAAGATWTATYNVPLGASSIDLCFNNGQDTWDNNGGRDWQFAVTGAAAPRFVMDAALDSAAYEIAEYNGMKLWAAVRGTKLYVATWGTGPHSGIQNDHFIMFDKNLGDATTAPWVKQGFVFLPTNFPYLAAEGGNEWSGWFNVTSPATNANSNFSATYNYLEGEIDLVDHFGSVPPVIYVAVGVYANNDGDPMVAQVPIKWEDNSNIEVFEVLRVPIASIRDEDGDGAFDGGNPMMWTVVNGNTNNANYGLRRFFLDEVKGDQEHLTAIVEPRAGDTNQITAIELFSNLNRRDFAKLPGDENPDSVTATSINTYYRSYPMTHLGDGRYSVTVPVNRCGVYRVNARWKINNGPWRYYTDNGLRRDCAVVVSPKKALDTVLYELNPLTAEARDDSFFGRSTFRNMYLDDTDRPNAISTNKLRQLGVNMVWLQPIHPIGTIGRETDPTTGQPFDPGSPYAVRDYWQVNPVLGDPDTTAQAMTEFTNFVAQYDNHGIGVMLDGTFNHSAWDCQIGQMAVNMGLKNSQGVAVNPADRISAVRPAWYSKKDSYGEPASYFTSMNDNDMAVAPDRFDFFSAPLTRWSDAADFFFGRYDTLVQKPPSNLDWFWGSQWHKRQLREDDNFEGFTTDATRELWEYFAAYPIYWLEKTGHPAGTPKNQSYKGIDGLRCDFAQGLPNLFWEYAINKTRTVKWDFLFMAESLDGYVTLYRNDQPADPRHGVGYRSSRQFDILNENFMYVWRNEYFAYKTYGNETGEPNRTTGLLWNNFDVRKNAFEMSPILLNTLSHDETFPTDDQWSLIYATAINMAMDGVPMVFYSQEYGGQNNAAEYGARTDFSEGISPLNNFARYEMNFGKSIPHFKRYNHMTNIWNAAAWKDTMRGVYSRLQKARENSPALRSQQNYFLSRTDTDGWDPDIFAVAKFQQAGAPVSTQDVVFAFVNNNFRANQSRAGSFKLNAPTGSGANWFGIQPDHLYNVVDIASANPTAYLWGSGILGSELIANGIYVGFQPDATFDGGQAQYIRLIDMTAGMTATSVNDLFANPDRYPSPVLTGLSNRTVAVATTLSFAVNVTKDPADTVTLSCQSTLAPNNFAFTPVAGETGPHTFLFTATGRDGFDEELITITVTSEAPPTPYEVWAAAVGLDPDAPNGAPDDNFDNDPYTNEQEYHADTDPRNADSFPRIELINPVDEMNADLLMDKTLSGASRTYVIHAADQVVDNGWNWVILKTNISTTGILPVDSAQPILMYKVTIQP